MKQVQSRRVLIVVGVAAVALLASPFVLQSWNSSRELAGKALVFDQPTGAVSTDLLRCLVQRPVGGLVLTISRENEFYDARRGIAVRIELVGPPHRLRAWATPGTALTAGERGQLNACLNPLPAPAKT